MESYVALLRAVNVAKTGSLRMADLRRTVEALGYGAVRTWLQSGNVTFESRAADRARLERALEQRLSAEVGVTTDFLVRRRAEWRRVLEGNPFPQEAIDDPAHVTVLVLKRPPAPPAWTALTAAVPGRERVVPADEHAYIYFRDGIGTSRLTTALLERKLGVRGTVRNWNTVRKLGELVGA